MELSTYMLFFFAYLTAMSALSWTVYERVLDGRWPWLDHGFLWFSLMSVLIPLILAYEAFKFFANPIAPWK